MDMQKFYDLKLLFRSWYSPRNVISVVALGTTVSQDRIPAKYNNPSVNKMVPVYDGCRSTKYGPDRINLRHNAGQMKTEARGTLQ